MLVKEYDPIGIQQVKSHSNSNKLTAGYLPQLHTAAKPVHSYSLTTYFSQVFK